MPCAEAASDRVLEGQIFVAYLIALLIHVYAGHHAPTCSTACTASTTWTRRR